MKRSGFIPRLLFLFSLMFVLSSILAHGQDTALKFGINALALKSPWTNPPAAEDLLADSNHTVLVNQFYSTAGDYLWSMPTEFRISYDQENLFVAFRCREIRPVPPVIHHGTNWLATVFTPPDQDSEFPDKVDFFVQPRPDGPDLYQFAVTVDGMKFGCKRTNAVLQTDEEISTSPRVTGIDDFNARVIRKTNEWTAVLDIPWKTIGGKPETLLGLLPVRSLWRGGAVISPVAFDFTERPPVDRFIETYLSNDISVQVPPTVLSRLPSGALRWQKPAMLTYLDIETKKQIWQLQQSLSEPTDTNNLGARVYLVQRWTDLLTLEGFNFRPASGSIVDHDMTPARIRREVNVALQKNEPAHACKLLDAYLNKLDKYSRDWFADGSPGDILNDEWKSVSEIDGVETNGNELRLHCRAGDQPVDLYLSVPKSGGVRLHGGSEGFFKPDGLSDQKLVRSSHECSFPTADGKVVIDYRPFDILFFDAGGRQKLQIGPGDIAFLFKTNGEVAAANFQNRLTHKDVIYGFGEKYDRLDQNGNVLTLWGMDDWTGNTIGLMNQSYKPVPVFHDSRGYTVFDNSSYRLRCDIGQTVLDEYRLTQPGPVFDYYFWISTPEKAIESYTTLTGKPILPPKWAFEPWIGRTGRGWAKPSHNPVAEEESVVKRFAELDIPHSAIYSEGAGADSAELNQFMTAHGLKVLSWFFPVIGEGTQAKLMPELKPAELPVIRTRDPWQHVDFSNPNALELARRWWQHRLDIGVAGSMVDFGDRVTEDAVFHDGKRGDEMHNFYAYDYQRTYSEVFREKRGDDFMLIGRAAAPGSQRWVGQFGGDHSANFAGLRGVLNGALNLCACGFSTWGSDLGGFLGWPDPESYMRWTEFGCFSPLMRCHGRTPREPWNYGDAAVANYKYYTWVRENLLDYIYDAAIEAHETGIPIMRSVPVAFPDKIQSMFSFSEYMFGPDLLVAPVTSGDGHDLISLPTGRWTGLWDGRTITGPDNTSTQVPLDQIPVYIRLGAIFPVRLNPDLQFGESMSSNLVTALVLTPPATNSSWTDAQNEKNSVRVERKPDRLALSLSDVSGFNYVLMYDAPAVTSVGMNGENLPPDDWRIDPSLNRLIIHLPEGINPAAKLEVRFRPGSFK